jgi:hypothetical protein
MVDNNTTDLKETGFEDMDHLTLNSIQWQALVNLWVPQVENFLSEQLLASQNRF